MFGVRTNAKRLKFLVEKRNDVPRYILTDGNKLRQILMNLLSNAVKFTAEGGIILRVGAKGSDTDGLRLVIDVEDTGVGIAPEELEKVFEIFNQTASGRKTGLGTGLGLAISREYVRMMEGEITARSQEGEGTTFHLVLPVEEASELIVKEKKPRRRVLGLESNPVTPCILVAEDNRENRKLLVKLLETVGFDVREAVNGRETLEIWKDSQPDLIWMDIRMPVMDGYEATRRIRKLEDKHLKSRIGNAGIQGSNSRIRTPIIALTASPFEKDRQRVVEAGCDDFVCKPFRVEEIFELMRKHLGLRYVYAEPFDKSVSLQVNTDLLVPSALANLPPDLLASMEQDLIEGNKDLILGHIDQIRLRDEALAETLTRLVDDFEYAKILNSIVEANEHDV
jgi:CheY-like chemotaxis protein